MLSGFFCNVQGHIIANKFVVLEKVRHSQRMNDALIQVWIITAKDGTINCAHCLGCKAGLTESCSRIASVLFYLEAWTKVNGRLSCTQIKCPWILSRFANKVEYSRVRNINFKSAKICQSINIQMTNQQIDQVQKDTNAQSSGTNVFKHSAGRIGASQSKAAAHSDQALSSQSLIQRICYPELHKVNTKAVLHGCQHEASAICAFEESLEEL